MTDQDKMAEVSLVEPTGSLEESFIDMLDECKAAGDEWYGKYDRWTRRDFEGYVEHLRDRAAGRDIPAGRVPDSHYWLVRGDRVIGTSRLRHSLTPLLEQHGGHIGYHIRPTERGRGYATKLLALTLDKARELGLKQVLLTADSDNNASIAVIRKNGGVLENEIASPLSGKPIRRFWIDIA